MEETMVYHQEIPNKNKRMNDYMQNIVSNNNNYKCECCPYGHHVNVDFVEFAKDISNSHNELQKIRRYQRKLERAQNNLLNKSDVFSTFPKDSIVMSRNFSNQLSCSSSDSNSSDVVESNITQIDIKEMENNLRKCQLNDVVYITNNVNDCTYRSSDESNIQSLNIDYEDDNLSNNLETIKLMNSSKNPLKTTSKPSSKPLSKSNSYNSKSFVVSYEHLMSIREQMSASLKRVQDLEIEVKNIPSFRQKIDILTKENQQLKSELIHQKETIEINNSKPELNRKINEISTNWNSLSDLPNQLIPNLERLLNRKLLLSSDSISIQHSTMETTLISKSTQTEVNSSVVLDTLSYFTESYTKDSETQINSEELLSISTQKVRKRNFGVTVRPTHHHFTQQISLNISPKPCINEESLGKLVDWLKICQNELDKKIGVLIYNLIGHLFENSYQNSIDLLKEQFERFSYNYKSMETKFCQTLPILSWDISCQTNTPLVNYFSKGCQIQTDLSTKATFMNPIITRECSTNSNRVISRDSSLQTDSKSFVEKFIQTDQNIFKDFSNYYQYKVQCSDISSITDQYLIDDLIADQIERSIEMIHNELKLEIMQSSKLQQQQEQSRRNVVDTYESSDKQNSSTNIVNTFSSYSNFTRSTTHDLDTQTNFYREPVKIIKPLKLQAGVDFNSPIIDNSIRGEIQKQALMNLKRCEITYSHFDEEEFPKPLDPVVNDNQVNNGSSNQELNMQIMNESDQSNSTSSSPREATYYSADGRIEYKKHDVMEELDETAEDINDTMTLMDTTNDKIVNNAKLESYKTLIPSFPEKIQEACEMIALWMNDSTTTCSKDLNESLAVIRQFWFEVTSEIGNDVLFYLNKFSSFNPTLQERVINMTDSNGNTCLHYAVSDGRWSIVKLLLQTHQVNVNKTNNAGYTVLMLVAVSEIKIMKNIEEESLKMLIDASEIDKQSLNDTQQTALMIAASQGKTKFVQFLLEKGASVNITDSDGSTALMCACDNGHLEVVRLLLTRPDTDTELEDNTGSNAMKIALDNSHKDIALLIFARNNLQRVSQRSKRRSGSSSHPTSPLNQRKFK